MAKTTRKTKAQEDRAGELLRALEDLCKENENQSQTFS